MDGKCCVHIFRHKLDGPFLAISTTFLVVGVKSTLVEVKSTLVGVKSTLSELSRPLVGVEFCRVELPFPGTMSQCALAPAARTISFAADIEWFFLSFRRTMLPVFHSMQNSFMLFPTIRRVLN